VVVSSIRSVAHSNTVAVTSGAIEVETNVGVSVARQMVVPKLRYVVDTCGPAENDSLPTCKAAVA
jgi:hypothetical protein